MTTKVSGPHIGLLAFQSLIVFLPLITFPAVTIAAKTGSIDIVTNTICVSLFGAGFGTLLISLRTRISPGSFLPGTSATPLFAASLIAYHSGGLGLLYTMCMISAVVTLLMTPIVRYFHRIFNKQLAGFISMMMGIWVSVLGVEALFFPDVLTPLLLHTWATSQSAIDIVQTVIGFITLAVMLAYRIYSKSKHHLYSILYGSVVGWILIAILGKLDIHKLNLISKVKWFSYPHLYSMSGYHFQAGLLLPFLIAGILSTLQVCSMQALIDIENQKAMTGLNSSRISKANLSAGVGTLITSFFGSPQSPNPAGFGIQYSTTNYNRQVAYVFSIISILLAFSPKISSIFLTIPAAVRGATIMFIGSGMFIAGLKVVWSKKFKERHGIAFALALLLGVSIGIIPSFYKSNALWIKGITYPTFLVSVTIFIVLNLIFSIHFKKATNNAQ